MSTGHSQSHSHSHSHESNKKVWEKYGTDLRNVSQRQAFVSRILWESRKLHPGASSGTLTQVINTLEFSMMGELAKSAKLYRGDVPIWTRAGCRKEQLQGTDAFPPKIIAWAKLDGKRKDKNKWHEERYVCTVYLDGELQNANTREANPNTIISGVDKLSQLGTPDDQQFVQWWQSEQAELALRKAEEKGQRKSHKKSHVVVADGSSRTPKQATGAASSEMNALPSPYAAAHGQVLQLPTADEAAARTRPTLGGQYGTAPQPGPDPYGYAFSSFARSQALETQPAFPSGAFDNVNDLSGMAYQSSDNTSMRGHAWDQNSFYDPTAVTSPWTGSSFSVPQEDAAFDMSNVAAALPPAHQNTPQTQNPPTDSSTPRNDPFPNLEE